MTAVAFALAAALVVGMGIPAFLDNEADNCFDVEGLSSLKICNKLEIFTKKSL